MSRPISEIQNMIILRKNGLTLQQIGNIYGVSKTRIQQILLKEVAEERLDSRKVFGLTYKREVLVPTQRRLKQLALTAPFESTQVQP